MYLSDEILIEKDKRAIANFDSGYLLPYESYSEEELGKIKSLAAKLYVEIEIDGKYAYLELKANYVEQISTD